MTAPGGGQTINTGVTIENQEAAAGVAVASGSHGLKRDEKESHYSKHVSSKTSFGNQTGGYLV